MKSDGGGASVCYIITRCEDDDHGLHTDCQLDFVWQTSCFFRFEIRNREPLLSSERVTFAGVEHVDLRTCPVLRSNKYRVIPQRL